MEMRLSGVAEQIKTCRDGPLARRVENPGLYKYGNIQYD
jgi:hypothetical protein